ncbi:MAG TPA: DUF1345 domain-containing protein [Phycisphaerae bacterium]|nr:DUF1345 domain-containing protein [Phycisphaerae bacterium]
MDRPDQDALQRAVVAVPEPRWPAIIAIAVSGLAYASLPESLSLGPRWLLLIVLGVIEVPALLLWHSGRHRISRWLGYVVSSILTLFVASSVLLLVRALTQHREEPVRLLLSAVALWFSNILVFALWYWRLDAGGPFRRDQQPGHAEGAFLFPQMTWGPTKGKWSPRFVDYLFLAFNTATAFSPTDVPVLSRWAKVLVMVESCISLVIIAVLVGRAINIM